MRGKTSATRGDGVRGQRVVVARNRRNRPVCSSGRPRRSLSGRPEALLPDIAGGRNQDLERIAKKSLRSRPNLPGRRPELQPAEERGVVCWFGATCVGVLLERMRLHLGTQRFLAERRGDRIWEASCDYAALSLERLESRLRPETFGAPLFPAKPHTLSRKHRKECGTRHKHSATVVARLFRGGVVSRLAPGSAPRLKTRATVKATAARGGR